MTGDQIKSFAAVIAAAGMQPPARITADRRIRMFSPDGPDTPADAWYVLCLDTRPAGAFGCKRKGLALAWGPDGVKAARTNHRAREMSGLQAQLHAFSLGIVSASARADSEVSARYAMRMLRAAERMLELGAQAGLADPLATEGEVNGAN
ncbi:hypothetical protein D3C87_782540 [compost metagenome]